MTSSQAELVQAVRAPSSHVHFEFARTFGFEPEPSSDSSVHETRRRRGQVKTIVLDEITIASGFDRYKLQIEVKLFAASKRSKQRTLK